MSENDRDIIRTVRLAPYRSGAGFPTWTLVVWDCHKLYRGGPQWNLGYELRQHDHDGPQTHTWVVFTGEDMGASAMHAIDSDATMGSILGSLTLRPGDTDSDYFANYTPEQMAFAEADGEALGCEAMARFDPRELDQ